jgi:hypothetical protein
MAFRIPEVVLVRLHVRTHVLRWQEPDAVTLRFEASRQVMCPWARFEADQARWHVRRGERKLGAVQFPLHHEAPARPHSDQVEHVLPNVDSDRRHLHTHALLSITRARLLARPQGGGPSH